MRTEKPAPNGRVRVLLTVPHLNPTASPWRETMSIARYLNRNRFDLTICALRDGGWSETQPLLRELGIPAFVTPFRPTGKTITHFWNSLRMQKDIASRGPFDIQHSMDFTSSPFEGVMARLARRPYVYSQRNLNENGHKHLLHLKTLCAHRIIGISDSVVSFLDDTGVPAERIEKIYLGLDLDHEEFRKAPLSPRKNYILVVGQIERRKRHEDAIRAFAEISAEFADLELCIAGNVFDSVYLDSLKELASSQSLAHRIHFLGPRRDAIDLMRNGRALLLCSEREAFGWVLLEAMAAGTPVIASASEGPSQIVKQGRTGLLVTPGDVSGYATALRRVLGEETLACSLATAARAQVEQEYSAPKMVQRIEDLYMRVAGQWKNN